jgi:hypothetical protein
MGNITSYHYQASGNMSDDTPHVDKADVEANLILGYFGHGLQAGTININRTAGDIMGMFPDSYLSKSPVRKRKFQQEVNRLKSKHRGELESPTTIVQHRYHSLYCNEMTNSMATESAYAVSWCGSYRRVDDHAWYLSVVMTLPAGVERNHVLIEAQRRQSTTNTFIKVAYPMRRFFKGADVVARLQTNYEARRTAPAAAPGAPDPYADWPDYDQDQTRQNARFTSMTNAWHISISQMPRYRAPEILGEVRNDHVMYEIELPYTVFAETEYYDGRGLSIEYETPGDTSTPGILILCFRIDQTVVPNLPQT